MFLSFDALSIYKRTRVDPLRQLGETGSTMDTTKSFYFRHVVSAQDDRNRWREYMIHYKGGTYLVLEATFSKMFMRVIHDALLVGYLRNVYDHEVPHVEKLFYKRVSRLQVFSECIVKNINT